ncbi:3',5'-bisphosphate nucleotidase [Endogone sp. FLAS-F59071]|nr:3',5'-bisphosphate nucleotidase [Endogone sp. FLAS-F59071]|eukprot:RUS20006.1 3',5'-bisphosphate nucleotidase [Endogone sp. FLAS-F59071]
MAAAFVRERAVAIQAVLHASKLCQTVFQKLVVGETVIKADRSPVTGNFSEARFADFSAQAVVNTILAEHFPTDPIVGEEDTKDLRGDEGKVLRNKVLGLTNEVLAPEGKELTEDKLLEAIDRGNYSGGPKGRQWTLDPIDGTMGFLRGGQFAVCLALIVDGEVQLGVMGCPNLPVNHAKPEGEKGCLFVARALSAPTEHRISFAPLQSTANSTFCESVEASHSSHDDTARIAARLGITRPSVRMDSQAKYCSISRGDADIYLRLPVGTGYEERIWDHASGSLLVTEAGGTVTDMYGQPLDFSVGRTLARNTGVVATAAGIHSEILEAVKAVLEEKSRI